MPNCYISLDYAQQSVDIYKKVKKDILREHLPINKEEPLKKEIVEFITLVRQGNNSTEYAQRAKNALSLACTIDRIVKK